MKRFATLGLSVAIIVMAAGFARADDKKDYKDKIVGSWVITKKDADTPEGLTIEFTKDSKLVVTIKMGDQAFSLNGSYTLEGEKLNVKLKFGEEEKDEKLTIKELTDDKLVTTDSKGKTEEFKKSKK
jgi:uncharacterized protein (TIGR03066 family)